MSEKTATYRCKTCGGPFEARVADRNRGWARFCSKSCKATKQTRQTGIGAGGRRPLLGGGWVMPNGEEFDRHGISRGFQMTQAELALGGYGDADWDTPLGDGKW